MYKHDRDIISSVQHYPELWYKNHCTAGEADLAWEEIANALQINGKCKHIFFNFEYPNSKIIISVDFIKRRWIHLKECFFKDVTLMRRDPKASSVFKHFSNMIFLCKKGSISKTIDTDSLSIKTERQQRLLTTITDENIEFSITQEDIDACEEDDEDIFVELSEEELGLPVQQRDAVPEKTNHITADVIAPSVVVPVLPQKRKAEPKDVSAAKVDAPSVHSDEKTVSAVVEPPPSKQIKCNAVAEQITTPAREPSVSKSEHRCEDTIFGELVAAMLQKMEDVNKKNAKRKIMNILLDC